MLGRSRVYPWVVEKPALVPNAFKRGWGLPRAYLAIKLESRYTNTKCKRSDVCVLSMCGLPGRGLWELGGAGLAKCVWGSSSAEPWRIWRVWWRAAAARGLWRVWCGCHANAAKGAFASSWGHVGHAQVIVEVCSVRMADSASDAHEHGAVYVSGSDVLCRTCTGQDTPWILQNLCMPCVQCIDASTWLCSRKCQI